jgi:carboxypeptidase Taq
MLETLNALKERLGTVTDLEQASALLHYDQEAFMPMGASQARATQLSTLSRVGHELFVSDEVGQWLEELRPLEQDLGPDDNDASVIRVVRKDYERTRKLPAEYVARATETYILANEQWRKARADSDFQRFLPWIQKCVDLAHEYAEYQGYSDHVYDALLDQFEPGMKTKDVEAIFTPLREETAPLVKAVAESGVRIDTSCLKGQFDLTAQRSLGNVLVSAYGFDVNRGRVDEVTHPFCTSISRDDVRMGTRVAAHKLNENLFSMLHECGHALYEQNVDPCFDHTPLSSGCSLGLHESQSRMWENLVGRGRPFWQWAYPILQAHFPSLYSVRMEEFYKAINTVTPSYIRVEADEVTYNLHIMLRFELEKAMMEGKVNLAQLPQEWNDRMHSYLGITPPNDRLGVLQDVHWSFGSLGYFPTYSLGNIISVQLWESCRQELTDLDDRLARGEFTSLLAWMKEKIHQHGRKYEPMELLRQVTGSEIDAKPYILYLKAKLQDVYGI